jgi:hypothetical protein
MTSIWGKRVSVVRAAIIIFGLSFGQTSLALQETPSQLITSYDLYWKGIRVVTADSDLTLTPDTYEHKMTWRTRGMLRWFVKGKTNAQSRGQLTGPFEPRTEHYSSDGKWGKRIFERTVSFDPTGRGTLVSITDPWGEENEREPMSEGLDVGPDPVTLAVLVLKAPLAAKESEPLTLTSYDGIRAMAYDITCNTVLKPLRKTGHSPYRGTAKECILKARQTGGFSKAPREREEKNPRENHGMSLLLQKLEGSDVYIPIQGTFTTDNGTLKLYLTTINQPLEEITAPSS